MPNRSRVILILVPLVLAVGVVAFLASRFTGSIEQTPPLALAYSAQEVGKLCTLMGISEYDSFCVNPVDQHPEDFEAMLERQYPVGQASYATVMTFLSDVPQQPFDCFGGDADSALDYCPQPDKCTAKQSTRYTCQFFLDGDNSTLKIEFAKPSGIVTGYTAAKAAS